MSLSPVLVWFLAGLLLVLAELFLPGVILVFFGLGAWLVAVTSALGLTEGLTSQLVVFGAGSLAMLLLLRRWFRSKLHGYVSADQDPADNLDNPAGEMVTVTVGIAPGSDAGRVEYKGAAWQARSNTAIPAGARARILETDGITLVVAPVA
jgi:membrane protein implicated in regulation of membrane protease activity